MYKFDIKFCNNCGKETEKLIPTGDHKLRDICPTCGAIHYQNPKIITGCLVTHNESVLLCQRNIEPQSGKWTIPAGFMENNESCEQGAARETREEANAEACNLQLYSVYDIPHISQVYMIYRASFNSVDFSPGAESLDVNLFDRFTIPWELLAFSVVKQVLMDYFNDVDKGRFDLHTGIITSEMKQSLNERPDIAKIDR